MESEILLRCDLGVIRSAMTARRQAIGATLLLAIAFTLRASAATDRNEVVIPANLDTSISIGLAFLAKHQNTDGSFDAGNQRAPMTSLSLLAFLSAGDAPDLGRYGLVVDQAAEWVLAQQSAEGYFGAGDRGMYTHAITTLALAEVYGVESNLAQRIRIHEALERAVQVIVAAQAVAKSNPAFKGGWRYERNSPDSDLSLSGWNVLALRAAADMGIAVPSEVRQQATEFVQHCEDAAGKGFSYQPGGGAQPGDTAIAMLCLYALDAAVPNARKLDSADRYLQEHGIDENAQFPYYATYFVAQATFQRGAEAWTRLGNPSLERLIRTQEKDGGWPQSKNGQEPGRIYATAMALGALTVPYRLLPVYQR